MRDFMIAIYIIGGFLFLILAVYFLDRREKMSHDIRTLKQKKLEIDNTRVFDTLISNYSL